MFSNRRDFLKNSSQGFGMLALSSLLARAGYASRQAHHVARAKHVIFCFMDGGPSHVDTFDYKPELARQEGKAIGQDNVSILSQSSAARVWFGSPWNFSRRGESGLWVSDLLPGIASIAI